MDIPFKIRWELSKCRCIKFIPLKQETLYYKKLVYDIYMNTFP